MLASSSNSTPSLRRWTAALAALAVAGCTEPVIDRPGTWQPTGANEHNLRAMLVNPQDATAGTGPTTARGDSAARAVTRLLTDHRRPLLNVAATRVGATADTPADSSSGAPTAGASTGTTP